VLFQSTSSVNAANAVFFMGNDGFYVYSGSVKPLPCPVAAYVYDDFNFDQKAKCYGSVNSAFSEVSWFYPSSESFECDRYVTFNYDEEVWYYGKYDMTAMDNTMSSTMYKNRTAWRDAVVFNQPMSVLLAEYTLSSQISPRIARSHVYAHDSLTRSPSPYPYIETGDLTIAEGDRMSFYTEIIPDVEVFNTDNRYATIKTTLKGQDYPGNPVTTDVELTSEFTGSGSYVTATNGQGLSVRGRGRSVRFRVESLQSISGQFRIGDFRLRLQGDGRR